MALAGLNRGTTGVAAVATFVLTFDFRSGVGACRRHPAENIQNLLADELVKAMQTPARKNSDLSTVSMPERRFVLLVMS
jgi:hypothetical protein